MPFAWNIALGIIIGGVGGYVLSRLFFGGGSYSLGANGFVRKPLDFGKLVQAVKAGLYWFVFNEAPSARCG